MIFTIKGIPDDLYRLLRDRAAEHRRSTNAEILINIKILPLLDPCWRGSDS